MATLTAEYTINRDALPQLRKRIEKLAKKAAKNDLTPISFEVIDHTNEVVKDREGFDKVIEYVVIRLSGETPVIAGWEFLGTLNHVTLDDGQRVVITRSVSEGGIPAQYRNAVPEDCDHCGKRRYRIDTFVVRNLESGETKQVGRNCLGDFLCTTDPHRVAEQAEYWIGLTESLSSGEYNGWNQAEAKLDIESVLSWTVAAVEKFGWLSRGKARQNQDANELDGGRRPWEATADRILWAQEHKHYRGCVENHFYTSDATREKGIEILEFVREYLSDQVSKAQLKGYEPSDYIWNLFVALRQSAIERRQLGLVTSAYIVWERETGKLAERLAKYEADKANAVKKVNEHFGKVGDKIQLDLTVIRRRQIEGQFGLTTIYTLEDSDGRNFVWFKSSGSAAERLFDGKTYTLKGSIKAHNEYQGLKQTVLTRCKVA